MTDLDQIVEQLMVAAEVKSDRTDSVIREKIRLILSLALQKQCNDNLDVIYKYANQWDKTKGYSLSALNDSDPTSRLVKLLFNLITDDINDVVKEYERTLSKND